ncbi:MAG: hypothetical protein HOH46_07960 [Rhodospirillaceae bacterium]|nr:hypothetical protein [Rhodospirillaceae bacterium]
MTEVEIDKKPVTTNAARNYVIVVVATAALLASVLATVAWRVGPPTGDLARIAGASERLFGWQDEVAGFKEDAYDLVSKDELLAGKSPGDILIFGDSFSVKHVGGVSWINTIVALTGLTANVVQIQDFHPVVNYLRSQAYREAPPKAIHTRLCGLAYWMKLQKKTISRHRFILQMARQHFFLFQSWQQKGLHFSISKKSCYTIKKGIII